MTPSNLLKLARVAGLDAYMTGETVRACNEQGRWVPVRTLLEIKQLEQAKRKAMPTSWMTRNTRHPFAY